MIDEDNILGKYWNIFYNNIWMEHSNNFTILANHNRDIFYIQNMHEQRNSQSIENNNLINIHKIT